jgi:predicted DNA-binding protein with PD1-like motif
MKNRIEIQAQQQYIEDITRLCNYGMTLQTSLKTYNISHTKMTENISIANDVMRDFRKKLNWLFTGNGYKRNPQYLPILVTSLEGTLNTYDKNKTLHYHIAFGNIDANRLNVDFLEKLTKLWIDTGIGTDNIKIHPLTHGREHGWGAYISKEAWKGNADCIDLDNTQIPKHLLAS